MTTLVAGLGNPILSDDGVGWVVAGKILDVIGIHNPSIIVDCYSLSGIALMEKMIGYEKVILIDSLNTSKYPQGEVISFSLADLEDLTYGHSASAHDLSLKKALILGRNLNINLPEEKNVFIVAIEARHIFDFGEELTDAVNSAVPTAVQTVLDILGRKSALVGH